MSKLEQYGGRIILTDGIRTVELIDQDTQIRYQYRVREREIERRSLFLSDDPPWEPVSDADFEAWVRARSGIYHPILDELFDH